VNAHTVTWTWTKGHARHEDNNRCDELASDAASDQISSEPGPHKKLYDLVA
jgi:ribonuclease HI